MQHTSNTITTYLEKLVLHRYTQQNLEAKIKNDFKLQDFYINKNDAETLEENDDSFIFTVELNELLVDVTMFYIYTNQTDTFIVTEVAYEFEVENIKVYAQNCMPDLIKQIYKWNSEGRESVEVSITDLLLMSNHIEDLELEIYGEEFDTINNSQQT